MSDEIAIESVEPVAVLARQRMWTRRLFVVITSAILTLVSCMFLGMKFGSAEQVPESSRRLRIESSVQFDF